MVKGFWRDRAGTAIETYAVGAVLAMIGAVFIGHAAEQYAADGTLPSIAFLDPGASSSRAKAPSLNAIDYATTGSIKGQVVILDPCTGQQKSP